MAAKRRNAGAARCGPRPCATSHCRACRSCGRRGLPRAISASLHRGVAGSTTTLRAHAWRVPFGSAIVSPMHAAQRLQRACSCSAPSHLEGCALARLKDRCSWAVALSGSGRSAVWGSGRAPVGASRIVAVCSGTRRCHRRLGKGRSCWVGVGQTALVSACSAWCAMGLG